MSTNVTFNGSSYTVPATSDSNWGTNVSNYLIAIASGCLQKTGGTFTLTAEVDFGANYGLKSTYYKTRATNPASAGSLRLGNAEYIKWRNAANGGDLALSVNSSDILEYSGTALKIGSATVSATELDYLAGVTSDIQTQLDGKQATGSYALTTGELSQFAATTSAELAGVISDETGSGALVFATSPSLTTPSLGAATATSINSTTIPSSKTLVVTTDKLSVHANTTSAELAGVISDETGSGALVFGTSPTITTPSTDVVTLDGQASTPSSPSSGNYKLYVDDSTQKLTVLDSAGVATSVGSGTGVSNYITANDGTTIGDWTTYADAAATSPVDGTGGVASSTFAVSTSSAMNDTTNFLWTHSAANRQGEGFSYTMAIDPADRARVLRLSFDYKIDSGTYADNDMTVWFYDVTNAALFQPWPYQIKNSGLIETFNSEVQVPSSCASLRVIFHVATSTATAYTLRFDNFVFGRQQKSYGSPITDATPVTMTVTNFGDGTITAFESRRGDKAYYTAKLVVGSSLPIGAISINLPSGKSIDTSKLTVSGNGPTLGNAFGARGATFYHGGVFYYTSSAVKIVSDGASAVWSNILPATWVAGDNFSVEFEVPITGWSSSVVMSNDAATNVVATRVTLSGDQTGVNTNASYVKVNFDSISANNAFDKNGAWASNKYTVQVPGIYQISALILIAPTNVLANGYRAVIYKNGVYYSGGVYLYAPAANAAAYNISDSVNAIAGDYFEIYLYGNGNNSVSTLTISSGATGSRVNISRLSGPAQIAASETVALRATNTSGTTIATTGDTLIDFVTAYDSHASLSSSIYTVPVSGKYRISSRIRLANSQSWTNGDSLFIFAKIDNTTYYALGGFSCQVTQTITTGPIINGSQTLNLLAGQTIRIVANPSLVATKTLNTSSGYNVFEIECIGNY